MGELHVASPLLDSLWVGLVAFMFSTRWWSWGARKEEE